jgi:hypothetical protein
MSLNRGLGAGGAVILVVGLILILNQRWSASTVTDLHSTPSGPASHDQDTLPVAALTAPPTLQTLTFDTGPATGSTSTVAPMPVVYFPVGRGSVDVIPHQVVRTTDDRLFIFAAIPYSTSVQAYWTTSAGLPNSRAAFGGHVSLETTADPLSLDAAYDGGRWIFVLANEQDGALRAFPFDVRNNVFFPGTVLARGNPAVKGDYLGTSGVSGMFDDGGTLQVVYWAEGYQIIHQSYQADSETGGLVLQGPPTRVDSLGFASHPVLATSADHTLTVAWISEAGGPARIRARTRDASGDWGASETISRAPVWHSLYFGVNIDQGPSLLIDATGDRHLTYIEDYGNSSDYGRVHHVFGSDDSWEDEALSMWSHDPALALRAPSQLVIIGHGHPDNSTCKRLEDMCYLTLSSAGQWSAPAILATAENGLSFDSSPSVKWSGAGDAFVRPETIEFAFFSAPYDDPTLYYGRLP